MKRIQSKKHKLGKYEVDKIFLSCFDDKRYVLDGAIYNLSYFHKNSVRSCNNLKGHDYWKRCNNWKRSWLLEKIVIIEKDCLIWKRL